MDVNFYFDSTDFACALAYKLGQLKEYPIKEQEFTIEVPKVISDYVEFDHDNDGKIILTSLLCSDVEMNGGFITSCWVGLSAFDKYSHNLLETKNYELNDVYLKSIVSEKMYLSDDIFPYGIGYRVPEFYESDILSGKFSFKLQPYELNKEYTIMCNPYEHGNLNIRFPSNDTIYKSFEHAIDNKDFVD
jgi:hypothetical protein